MEADDAYAEEERFKDLVRRSRANRALKDKSAHVSVPLPRGGSKISALDLARVESLNAMRRGEHIVTERGEQYSDQRQLASLRVRENIYCEHIPPRRRSRTSSKGSNKSSSSSRRGSAKSFHQMLRRWGEVCQEWKRERRSRNQAMRKVNKTDMYQWLSKRAPSLHKDIMDLHMRRMDLYRWFCLLDADGSGEISVEELLDPLFTVGLCTHRAQVEELVDSVDVDGSQEIGFEEFLSIIYSDPGYQEKQKLGREQVRNGIKNEPSTKKRNAIVELYELASTGELGDASLAFSNLLSSYRRKVIMRALAPLSSDIGTEQRANDIRCVDALQRLYLLNTYSR